MNRTDETIFVTGATGQQGGAVVRHLLKEGWRVRGLSRNSQKPEARALAELGAEIVEGDMEDLASLHKHMKGAYGVFSVQNYWTAGYEGEVRQGINVAEAAKSEGIRHLVYTSVGGADRNSGLTHFESKWEIEKKIAALGLPATILRPVFFMENYNATAYGFGDNIRQGKFITALPPDTKLQLIAVDDIGKFTAIAFSKPNDYIGKGLELAGDDLTMPETAKVFSRLLNRPVEYVQLPLEQVLQQNEEWGKMLQWFIAEGYKADIAALGRIYPDLQNFEQWARKSGWAV